MNIYFCGSIAGGRTYLSTYTEIVNYLQSLGHVIPTVHIIEPNVLDSEKQLTAEQIYQRDVEWLTSADAVIAEISNPSLGVGYEIGFALNLGKRVLALYRQGLFVSRMITGNRDANLTVYEYDEQQDWQEAINRFLHESTVGFGEQ